MKKSVILLLTGVLLLTAGCSSNTYNNLRKVEDKLIANYISRNQLHILYEEPELTYEWSEKDYYKVSGYDNLYFHLRHRGDSADIVVNDVIVTRYKKFALIENADTLSYWTTLDQAHPYEFRYGDLSSCDAEGWHVAVRLMKYPDSECEILVPSKQGFSDDQTSVTPYMYIIKIKKKQ